MHDIMPSRNFRTEAAFRRSKSQCSRGAGVKTHKGTHKKREGVESRRGSSAKNDSARSFLDDSQLIERDEPTKGETEDLIYRPVLANWRREGFGDAEFEGGDDENRAKVARMPRE